jgi:hypothetical protein
MTEDFTENNRSSVFQRGITLKNTVSDLTNNTKFWKGAAIILFAIIILTQLVDISIKPRFSFKGSTLTNTQQNAVLSQNTTTSVDPSSVAGEVLPAEGVELPINWGDLGRKMVADGVIDEAKFRSLFDGGFSNQDEQMLSGDINQPIVLTQENSRFILNKLWAFGLSNKNDILDNGEMTAPEYGGDASKFASTGGWSIAKGTGFDHYSKHNYVNLNAEQQDLVARVAKGIFRPCCGNSTHFPDCNHGMAMLGLLQLMAKNGVSEAEMYNVALKVNSIWFPSTYIELATYFKEQGIDWKDVDARTVLGAEYSSAQGYQQIRQQIQSIPQPQQGGGGCGV